MGKIILNLDEVMLKRKIALKDLAEQINITNANLSKIKNNHVSAIRFSTLAKLCEVLDCDVADILKYEK